MRTIPFPRRGQDHPHTALTDADVLRLREQYAAGGRTEDLAERYGLSRAQVGRIIDGTSWAHLTGGVSIARPHHRVVGPRKLTPAQVREIIDRYERDPGLNKAALGRQYGIRRQQVYYILTGQHWPQVTHGIDRTRKASV